MATFYSDYFVGTGVNTALPVVPNIVNSGVGGSRLRLKKSVFTMLAAQDLAQVDVIRMMPFKSSDRIINLFLSAEAGFGTTTPINVGLYKVGDNHDGAAISTNSPDMFVAALDIDAGFGRTDHWNQAAHWVDEDRGKANWELINLVDASTYTSDPVEAWELCVGFSGNPAAAAAEARLLIEAVYVSGD